MEWMLAMDMMTLLLPIGFGSGLYVRGLFARAEAARAQDEASGLRRQAETLKQKIEAMARSEAERQSSAEQRRQFFAQNDVTLVENQLRFISQANLHAIRPVAKEAARVLYALDEWIIAHQPDWRLAFEVAMGSFIKTSHSGDARTQDAAFSSYNSKRVDFLLIDRFGHPMLVVEYHGSGHDLAGDAADRMQVKRLALARAGIPLVELPVHAQRTDIFRMVNEALGASDAAVN